MRPRGQDFGAAATYRSTESPSAEGRSGHVVCNRQWRWFMRQRAGRLAPLPPRNKNHIEAGPTAPWARVRAADRATSARAATAKWDRCRHSPTTLSPPTGICRTASAQRRSAVRRGAVTVAERRQVAAGASLGIVPAATKACVRRRRALASRPCGSRLGTRVNCRSRLGRANLAGPLGLGAGVRSALAASMPRLWCCPVHWLRGAGARGDFVRSAS
jgi:hypothetical protein